MGTGQKRVRYEDDLVTEYEDGTEEVRFTPEEWAIMLADPAFGYVRACGHKNDGSDTCWTCEYMHEAEAADYEDGLR